MPTDIEYALMATRVYAASDKNRTGVPAGWTELKWLVDSKASGFSAGAYRNGNEVVIAYTGTNDLNLDWLTNGLAGTGLLPAPQIFDAMRFYLDIKAANPDATISFAGHSLGGGLASLMAVFFNKQAKVFDEAPFQYTAVNPLVLSALEASLLLNGYTDLDFALYNASFDTLFPFRESNVSHIYLEGEVLGGLRLTFPTIVGAESPISMGSSNLSAVDRHAMTLLTAMLGNDAFKSLVQSMPKLATNLLDPALFGMRDRRIPDQIDLLSNLLRRQYGADGVIADGRLDRFVAEMQKLIGDAGIAQTQLQDALSITAMEYFTTKANTTVNTFFTVSGGGLHFKYSDIGATSYKSLPRLETAVEGILSTAEKRYAIRLLSQNAWHIQQGSDAMSWAADPGDPQNDAAIGGAGGDTLSADAGTDILIGGAGGDRLTGGAGSDTLMGGIGTDTYVFAKGDGNDTIVDADGQGEITVDGVALDGGKETTKGSGSWISDDKNVLYTLLANGDGSKTLDITYGDSNHILVKDYTDGEFGITLQDGAPPTDTTTRIIVGDKDFGADGAARDDLGNPTGNATPGSGDYLRGGSGGDRIQGMSGQDVLLGGDGEDILEGGAGSDIAVGCAGNDRLYADGETDLAQAIAGGRTQDGSGIKGDWLNGADGDDIEVAGADNDALCGGHGSDTLVGGAGDDYLNGDDDWIARKYYDSISYNPSDFNWAVTDYGNPFGRSVGPIQIMSPPEGAADLIYAGNGNDFIFGGFGDDILYGENGDDVMAGVHDSDMLFGGDGNDTMTGDYGKLALDSTGKTVTQGSDYLDGGAGNDWMQGEGGDDTLAGGSGDDEMWGDAQIFYSDTLNGADYLDGGEGKDTLIGGGKDDELFGGSEDDTLRGDADTSIVGGAFHGDDYLDGEEGNDFLAGDGGRDTLFGGDGDDQLQGDYLNLASEFHDDDYLDGEDGDDTLTGGGGSDELFGGAGKDQLFGDADNVTVAKQGDDYLNGEEGDDYLRGFGGQDTLFGGAGDDQLLAEDGDDYLDGEDGNDVLDAGDGTDELFGGAGNDSMSGGAGADYLDGGDGDDLMTADDGDDRLFGGGGNNTLQGGAGNDYLAAGDGLDQMVGGDGDDVLDGGAGNDLMTGGAGSDRLFGGDGDDQMTGDDGDDTLDGGAGNDVMFSDAGNNSLNGGAGDDTLLGGDGDDTLDGGSGTDYLDGGAGNNTYIVHDQTTPANGVAHTTIANAGGGNRLVFDSGITAGSISFLKASGSGDLALKYGSGDMVYIINGLQSNAVSELRFADGTVMTRADLMALAPALNVAGSNANDDILGGAQADTLSGGAGDDRIAGSKGNDALTGGLGNDTYAFNTGDGQDVIDNTATDYATATDTVAFGNGISAADVVVNRIGNNLVLKAGASDSVTVTNYFATGGAQKIKQVAFADGTAWNQAALEARAVTVIVSATAGTDNIHGTAGNDVIHGLGGNDALYGENGDDQLFGDDGADTLLGNAGNDTLDGGGGVGIGVDSLAGGTGSDTYIYNKGYGFVTIDEYNGSNAGDVDSIVLGPNIAPSDIRLSRTGTTTDHLDLRLKLDDSNTITIRNFFARQDDYYRIEQVKFADGTVWTADFMKTRVEARSTPDGNEGIEGYNWADAIDGLGGNDSIKGFAGSDTLTGGGGNDILDAGVDDDVLDGGLGNDELMGGAGNDTYLFGRGYGTDRITETSVAGGTVDTIKLAAGIAPGDVSLYQYDTSLVLKLSNSTDELWMLSFYVNTVNGQPADNKIEKIVFNDGTTWDLNTIMSKAVPQGSANAMTGTAGDDTFVVDNTSDTITEAANQGTDTVQSPFSWTLGDNIENLTLTGVMNVFGMGNTLNNVIQGNSGNNDLSGRDGNDTVHGGSGNDTITGDNGTDVLYGDDGNDSLAGGANIDTLYGGAGNDTLDGISGSDVLCGGAGDDIYLVSGYATNGQITEMESEGIDTIICDWGDGGTALPDNVENLTINPNRLNYMTTEYLTGNTLNNRLTGGDYGDIINGHEGADTMIGGSSDDTFYVDNAGDRVIDNGGTDTVQSSISYTLGDGIEKLTLAGGFNGLNGTGNDGNNVITGDTGFNILDGKGGGDRLIGNGGADTLIGGAGSDTYVVPSSYDQVVIDNSASDNATATDAIELSLPSLYCTLYQSGDDLLIKDKTKGSLVVAKGHFASTQDNAIDQIKFSDGTIWDRAAINQNVVRIVTTSGADAIAGTPLADTIHGLEGDDTIAGDTGDDLLFGDDGNDSLQGGDGNDALDGGTGADYLNGGYGDDTVLGGNGDDSLSGGDFGNDLLDGGTGNDTLTGGYGNDAYVFRRGSGQDQVSDTDSTAGNRDTVRFDASIAATDVTVTRDANSIYLNIVGGSDRIMLLNAYSDANSTIERVEFANGTVWTANDLMAKIVAAPGTSGDDAIFGMNAGETLHGLDGNDMLSGSGGADQLYGDAGNDTLGGDTGIDTLIGGDGNDTYLFNAGDGQDQIDNTASDNAAAVDTLVLGPDVTTNSVTLNRSGDDLIVKLNASDSITVKNYFLANSDQKIDRIQFDDGTIWDQATLEQHVAVPTAGADNLTGGAGSDTIHGLDGNDTISGGAGGDQLFGDAGNDTLNGEADNDTLDGGAGSDKMAGGTGDDVYIVDSTTDTIVENANEGIDTVKSSVTFTLGSNVENLTLTGSGAINGTGNALNNVLVGNSGTNTLKGGAGNDTYYVSTGDTVTENSGEGSDTVVSDVTWTLGSNLENLTLSGTNAINGTGNTLNNVLVGNTANNTLSGGTGIDTMSGGAGDDTYIVDNTSDVVIENASEGIDLAQSSVTYTLSANVENLTLTSTSAINGTGNASDNILTGNSAANTLTGGGGNDTLDGGSGADKLIGGAGNDTYIVDNTSDTVTENANEGIDLVKSSVTHTLAANVEALMLTGTGIINGTGNTLDNLIAGNGSANVLNGSGGNDLLQGMGGNDTLTDTSGNNFFDGGVGADSIAGGAGNDFIAGNAGNDTITTSTGADVIAFNRGDGQDVINASTGKDNTLSLGKGIKYADLQLKKSSNDLILVTGTSEQVTFKDWYLNTNNHSVANLQIVIEGTTDYNAASSNSLNNKKIEQFNFDGLVTAFDQARAANSSLTSWALSSSLLKFYLASSDTAAIGGDLAYQYARNGNFSNISASPAQAILGSSQFGVGSQNLRAVSELQDMSPRLA